MPTDFHEFIISNVVFKILSQLKLIAKTSKSSAEFAKVVRHGGSATIDFPNDPTCGTHSPNAIFKHLRATYLGVIIKMSFSQKKKDVEKLAYEYILGSDGSIKVVIRLDIKYRGRNKGTLSIWRPRIITGDNGETELVVEKTVLD